MCDKRITAYKEIVRTGRGHRALVDIMRKTVGVRPCNLCSGFRRPVHLGLAKARRTYSRLCLLTTQLNRREQIRSRLVGVHCHDRAIQTWRFSQGKPFYRDRKARVNSQEEVTPQKAFPPDTNKTKTLKKRCHASDVATKIPANEVELMSYLIYGG